MSSEGAMESPNLSNTPKMVVKGKRVALWIKAEMGNLTEISRVIQEWLARQEGYRDDPEERYLVELAVIEACTNIIRYAYADNPTGRLGLCLRGSREGIRVYILDEGAPFDPTHADAPDLDEPQEGGYGIFLIHQIMKEVHYERRGVRWNRLVLVRGTPAMEAKQEEQKGKKGTGWNLE